MAYVTRSIRVDPEVWESLKELAEQRGTTASALTARLLKRLVEQQRVS